MRLAWLWLGACALAAGAPVAAQELTARETAEGVRIEGLVTLPDACWQAGALTEGAPEGAPEIGNAAAATLALEHDAGAMCAQMLVEAEVSGTVAGEGRPYVVVWFAAPGGAGVSTLPDALVVPVE